MKRILPVILVLLVGCDEKKTSYDTGEEEEEFVCTPTTTMSECNAQYNCGCDSGDWCRWMFSSTECQFYEGCTPSVPGTEEPGAGCDPEWHYPDPPWCLPGSTCIQGSPPETGTCRELCETAADCPEGQECWAAGGYILPSEICDGGPITPPYSFCF
jgi:hypothetical protein